MLHHVSFARTCIPLDTNHPVIGGKYKLKGFSLPFIKSSILRIFSDLFFGVQRFYFALTAFHQVYSFKLFRKRLFSRKVTWIRSWIQKLSFF